MVQCEISLKWTPYRCKTLPSYRAVRFIPCPSHRVQIPLYNVYMQQCEGEHTSLYKTPSQLLFTPGCLRKSVILPGTFNKRHVYIFYAISYLHQNQFELILLQALAIFSRNFFFSLTIERLDVLFSNIYCTPFLCGYTTTTFIEPSL